MDIVMIERSVKLGIGIVLGLMVGFIIGTLTNLVAAIIAGTMLAVVFSTMLYNKRIRVYNPFHIGDSLHVGDKMPNPDMP